MNQKQIIDISFPGFDQQPMIFAHRGGYRYLHIEMGAAHTQGCYTSLVSWLLVTDVHI